MKRLAAQLGEEFDEEARQTVCRLAQAFNLPEPSVRDRSGRVSMGLEIEVPWSSYFPQLWDKYDLANRKVYSLSKDELDQLGLECAEIEKTLLPRLQQSVECGVPRGNDRYWEFALRPSCQADLLVQQVGLLTQAGLLPRDKRHSLQVTIGGIPPCKSLYKLAMLLEVEFVDPDRIRSGIDQMGSTIHTGWGRKGRAGVHLKGGDELQGGAQVASELRMLQLPQDERDLARLMATVEFGVNAIMDLREGLSTEAAVQWQEFESATTEVLLAHGLPDANWFSSGSDGGVDSQAWERFADRLDVICDDLMERLPNALVHARQNASHAMAMGRNIRHARVA